MKQLFLVCLLCSLVVEVRGTAQVVELYQYTSSTPKKVTNVENGSNLYLSSADANDALSKITISTKGQTRTLQTLLNNLDENGFTIGIPVNSDLTISTTNTADVTENLNGILFISNAAMAKDPNFLVYLVEKPESVKLIDRQASQETTLVLLNKRVERQGSDPVGQPYYYSRVENIVHAMTTTVLMYQGIPTEQYSDPTYKTSANLIFRNPVNLLPTGNPDADTMFFSNVEPIQYTLRSYHIRALGPVRLTVSKKWEDLTTYMTTNETTTGYTMSQMGVEKATVDFKYTSGHDGKFGYMITTSDMQADLNVTSCGNTNCYTKSFLNSKHVAVDFFQYDRNDTSLYINPANRESGIFHLQYFRIEEGVSPPGMASTTTTTRTPETTTKLGGVNNVFVSCVVVLSSLCRV